MRIADGSQGAAKILTSDANGTASWQSLSAESIFGSGNVPGAEAICFNNVATIAAGSTPNALAVAGNYAYVVNIGSSNMRGVQHQQPGST
ncbi:MAG: hypothetical protein IPO05_07840 [Flavobacteriales bacterium]|nr:hypothetical protein [Flavobacteriales bacterium]